MKVVAFNGSPREGGAALQDAEGLANLRALGENMAWLMEKLR